MVEVCFNGNVWGGDLTATGRGEGGGGFPNRVFPSQGLSTTGPFFDGERAFRGEGFPPAGPLLIGSYLEMTFP